MSCARTVFPPVLCFMCWSVRLCPLYLYFCCASQPQWLRFLYAPLLHFKNGFKMARLKFALYDNSHMTMGNNSVTVPMNKTKESRTLIRVHTRSLKYLNLAFYNLSTGKPWNLKKKKKSFYPFFIFISLFFVAVFICYLSMFYCSS